MSLLNSKSYQDINYLKKNLPKIFDNLYLKNQDKFKHKKNVEVKNLTIPLTDLKAAQESSFININRSNLPSEDSAIKPVAKAEKNSKLLKIRNSINLSSTYFIRKIVSYYKYISSFLFD